ncbi:MAG: polysaccharide pyruvyl transferase family protein [Bacteroidales bacterium]|nr:polysaccharide pyruvyl transferase family protein [Bacteroidales bacterium]
MKIGILTFWWTDDNYGQILQCYALQKFLQNMGHDAFLIQYHQKDGILESSLRKHINRATNPSPSSYSAINQSIATAKQATPDRLFESFRQKYIDSTPVYYTSLHQLRTHPPEADIYIVGSDQVWNLWNVPINLCRDFVHIFFLDFGPENIRRISYAASWGRATISDEEKAEITPLLRKFYFISVREESGINLCQQCGRPDAQWVCDPTLLLHAQYYRRIYQENPIRKPYQKFLLLYLLNTECEIDINNVYQFAAERGLQVVYITGNSRRDHLEKFYATIPEWLYLIDNAQYVVTNSYHGGVFAIIFHKQFAVAPLTGKFASMNTRFTSLFQRLNTGNRFILNGNLSILDSTYQNKVMEANSDLMRAIAPKK